MNIVVRGTNWVGDAVMSIPALRELRGIIPTAKITLNTRRWATGIFQDADFVDEILVIEENQSVLSQAKDWRKRRFDAAILFTNSFQSALVARMGHVPRRFGYAKEARSILLTDSYKIPGWKNERHEIYYYLNLVGNVCASLTGSNPELVSEPRFELDVSEIRRENAKRILAENGVDLSRKTVVFVSGSTNSRAKRWSPQSFAKLNDRIQFELKANVVLIGAENELEVSDEVFANCHRKPTILTGKTSLDEVTAILSVCDMLISNDTGPAHIAAALGIKTIVIFGPTNPITTKPWNSEIIREENLDCSPCMLRDCPIDHRCMTRISPERVFEKAASML